VLQRVAGCCSVLQYAVPVWTALRHFNGVNGVTGVAVCCSLLQSVAVCYACLELQCVAMFVCPCVSVSVRVYMT